MNVKDTAPARTVRHFRQTLLWPLQLMPIADGAQIQKHWELLKQTGPANPWRELSLELGGDGAGFQRRHYNELVTFLPKVQRFLYGEGFARGDGGWHSESPVRVFRRRDIAKARVTYRGAQRPVTFEVGHVELYFFYDIDVVLLAVEIFSDDLSLELAQETLYGLGRAYPLSWDADGAGSHCVLKTEWLSAGGEILGASDYEKEQKYLAFVARYRSPYIAAHWEFLLKPLALHYSGEPGPIRYRQIEYHRMPLTAYLALDDPAALTRADFIRMGLAAAPGEPNILPYAKAYLQGFDERYCYDRYWCPEIGGLNTRFVCSGRTLIVVGSAGEAMFVDPESGLLGQLRHQYFLLFNHRYWLHDISDQAQARELFQMCITNLGTESLYSEVREEIQGMSGYLDSDTLRHQSNSMVRLTVATIFGTMATVTTGFLGMNLIAEADATTAMKILYFVIVGVPCVLLAFYVILKSKRLSDFLDAHEGHSGARGRMDDRDLSSRALCRRGLAQQAHTRELAMPPRRLSFVAVAGVAAPASSCQLSAAAPSVRRSMPPSRSAGTGIWLGALAASSLQNPSRIPGPSDRRAIPRSSVSSRG